MHNPINDGAEGQYGKRQTWKISKFEVNVVPLSEY
jgi:hypothetical protein